MTLKPINWQDFDFSILKTVQGKKRPTRYSKVYADCLAAADTETSKINPIVVGENMVVCWSFAILVQGKIHVVYGRKPSEFCLFLRKIVEKLENKTLIVYFHNLAYDYVFLRKFLYQEFGTPTKQLATKPHYPIQISFKVFELRDSLILAQRNLDKWSRDMAVEHQKAVGFWDYEKIRDQQTFLSDSEITYISNDVVALIECLAATAGELHRPFYNLPLTATAIPRGDIKEIGGNYHAHAVFEKEALTFEQYQLCEQIYSGGYVHADRGIVGWIQYGDIQCFDFGSSYPARLIYSKYPRSKFFKIPLTDIETILKDSDKYAYMIRIMLKDVHLKDPDFPMPFLQAYKCKNLINYAVDNGRILDCEFCEIAITEIDLKIINSQYNFKYIIKDCQVAVKDYLPQWFRNYVLKCYREKSELKGGDPVKYQIAKGKLNSLYGMCVQKNLRETIKEDYETGEYNSEWPKDPAEVYQKFVENKKTILPYQWGVWCTAYAREELFKIGQMADQWLYSDTDSCYLIKPNVEKINQYNKEIENLYKSLGYPEIKINGKPYIPGKAEPDGQYTEFITLGAKRYACRISPDEIKITVAGVPKKAGASCMENDLGNFRPGFNFPGEKTGKKTHTYFFTESIKTDSNGNELGDSIDLSPCDYLLDKTSVYRNFDDLITDELRYFCYDNE